jgi:Fic family protein
VSGNVNVLIYCLIKYVNEKNVNGNIIHAIFKKTYFTIKYIQQGMSVSYNTAKRYTEVLVELGRIYPDDKKKNKVYRFYDLMDLMR